VRVLEPLPPLLAVLDAPNFGKIDAGGHLAHHHLRRTPCRQNEAKEAGKRIISNGQMRIVLDEKWRDYVSGVTASTKPTLFKRNTPRLSALSALRQDKSRTAA
jgi:hypothetical protein